MLSESVVFSVTDSVAEITLNRPDVLNSFNKQMSQEFIEALQEVRENREVRAVLLNARGRGFCAGQDLAEFKPVPEAPPPNLGEVVRTRYNPAIRLIREIEKPFVCAVNGIAAGAGASFAFACDIVFAASSASFVQAFCKVGLIPDSGGTFLLPRLVGIARATALSMLGEKVTAEEAARIGLIYKVLPEVDLDKESRSCAAYLSTQPTLGLGLTKRAINASLANDLESQLLLEGELQHRAGKTKDYAEGVAAFFEKRPPRFSGE